MRVDDVAVNILQALQGGVIALAAALRCPVKLAGCAGQGHNWGCIWGVLGVHWGCIMGVLGVHWGCVRTALGIFLGVYWGCTAQNVLLTHLPTPVS